MSLFNTRSFTINRKTGGNYDSNGEWVAGSITSIPATGTIQPANGQEMGVLPEGRRSSFTYRVYTNTMVRTTIQADGSDPLKESDELLIDGDTFEVVLVASWQNGLINHYKAFATKKKEIA